MRTLDHWARFADFARLDRLAGGPDSHMKTVVALSDRCSAEERVWRAGLYAGAVYNVPTAEALWYHWPWERVEGGFALLDLTQWIRENWAGFGFRRERRPVRTPVKMNENLQSLARWVPKAAQLCTTNPSYDELWKSASEIKFVGRYALLKLTETLRQMGLVSCIVPDLRPEGGWSPREGLTLLWPTYSDMLRNAADDDAEKYAAINALASVTQDRLANEYGVALNNYEFQVFCCDYKQAVAGRQYPGRSLDSELEYAAKVCSHDWRSNFELRMWEARARLFPPWALGEQQGWSAVRPELGECLRRHDYLWTDSCYDYYGSTPARPVALQAVQA